MFTTAVRHGTAIIDYYDQNVPRVYDVVHVLYSLGIPGPCPYPPRPELLLFAGMTNTVRNGMTHGR